MIVNEEELGNRKSEITWDLMMVNGQTTIKQDTRDGSEPLEGINQWFLNENIETNRSSEEIVKGYTNIMTGDDVYLKDVSDTDWADSNYQLVFPNKSTKRTLYSSGMFDDKEEGIKTMKHFFKFNQAGHPTSVRIAQKRGSWVLRTKSVEYEERKKGLKFSNLHNEKIIADGLEDHQPRSNKIISLGVDLSKNRVGIIQFIQVDQVYCPNDDRIRHGRTHEGVIMDSGSVILTVDTAEEGENKREVSEKMIQEVENANRWNR